MRRGLSLDQFRDEIRSIKAQRKEEFRSQLESQGLKPKAIYWNYSTKKLTAVLDGWVITRECSMIEG